MITRIFSNEKEMAAEAAKQATDVINKIISEKDQINLILATGSSQFEVLENLTNNPEINWGKVVMFHLDEYIGIPESHPASFRKYLKDRFINKVKGLKASYFLNGNTGNPEEECERLNNIIKDHPIDLALVGIGENGHLAFNDPPADFDTEAPYIVVDLDERCRKQQMGEGWFNNLEDVPKQAISMSIKQILKSKTIICSVPGKRKSEAVINCLEGEVTNLHPASILQKHADCTIYLDEDSASLLSS